MEVVGGGARRRVVDLAEVVDEAGGQRTVGRRDWTPVAVQRGIAQACEHFLIAVRDGRPISARDARETRRLCERIVREVEA